MIVWRNCSTYAGSIGRAISINHDLRSDFNFIRFYKHFEIPICFIIQKLYDEKAVDAITAEVIIETQNQDIARLDSVRKWVEDPKIKRSKAERAFGIKVLDNAADFLKKGIDRIIAAVKKKFLQPEVKKQKTEEIKREARKSIYTYLEEARAELAEKRAMQIGRASCRERV